MRSRSITTLMMAAAALAVSVTTSFAQGGGGGGGAGGAGGSAAGASAGASGGMSGSAGTGNTSTGIGASTGVSSTNTVGQVNKNISPSNPTTTERRLKCAASSERHSQRTERATVRSATVARLSEVGWQKEKGPGSLRGFDCRWRTSGQRPLIAFSLALLEQIATNFWLNDGAVAKGRRSTLRLGRHKSQLF